MTCDSCPGPITDTLAFYRVLSVLRLHLQEYRTHRPHPEEPRRVGPPAHAYSSRQRAEDYNVSRGVSRTVVAGAITAPDYDSELRNIRARDRADHLRAVLGDSTLLCFRADHVPSHVHEEEQRDLALRAELDEVRCLERRLGEEDAVVGDYAHGVAVYVGEALRGRSECLQGCGD